MKTGKAPILVLLIVVSGYAFWQYQTARGSDRILETMRSIRQGHSKDEIKKFMGREPSIIEASSLPDWMKKVVPEKAEGEYWHYFMGYPPRVLIIYFGADQKVAYVTWTDT